MASHLPPITISTIDLARLDALLETPALRDQPGALALGEDLNRATVPRPEELPADVVTPNSRGACVDGSTGEKHSLTLVFPRDADGSPGKVSVLAPVASALLGLSVGQSID